MAELDEIHSDEELMQATKEGTIREGTARIHFKLFPKYGFLIPDNPHFNGETIFFGLTAHVDASRKYIADLRDELYPEQKVKYMAVPVERNGTIKWKGLVVGPLSADEDKKENDEELEQAWLTCRVHYNLQPTHGFATPDGGNQYYDNVYFSLREASEGMGEQVTDLTKTFIPGEEIRALVVPADSRFKAKYRAIKICKALPPAKEVVLEPVKSPPNSDYLVEELDLSAVSWFREILDAKGSAKLTSLTGDLSRNPDVRAVVQPRKKSMRRFLAKYPKYFSIKDDMVYPMPDCPPLRFTRNITPEESSSDVLSEGPFSSDDDTSTSDSSDDDVTETVHKAPTSAPAPRFTKTLVNLTSLSTIVNMAKIVNQHRLPIKMSEVFRQFERRGWQGMNSVAMVAQIITSNAKYFALDDWSCVFLTAEGRKLLEGMPEAVAAQTANGPDQTSIPDGGVSGGTQAPRPFSISSGAKSAFTPTSAAKLSNAATFPCLTARKAYTPVSAMLPGLQTKQKHPERFPSPDISTFPTSSVLTNKSGGFGHDDEYVYHSDNEDSTDEKLKSPSKLPNVCTDEESAFLTVVAHAFGQGKNRESLFHLLNEALATLGVKADGEGGVLSRHLLCVQIDRRRKPRAKFQVFTPSGKISQTTVTLPVEKVSDEALSTMLNESLSVGRLVRVGRLLYGVVGTNHYIRLMINSMNEEMGCTAVFQAQTAWGEARVTEVLKLGERGKMRVILTDPVRGTVPSAACAALRRFADDQAVTSMVSVIDMEGQIFGFGRSCDARHLICGTLDMQQHHLKEAVHHKPNYVVVNCVDCVDTLSLLERIHARGIGVFAEVARSLETNVKNLFKVPA